MTFKIKQKKVKEKKTFAVENPKKNKKQLFIEDIKNKGTITEKELLLVKRRLNDGTYKYQDVQDLTDLKLTPEQNAKGLKWLKNQGWTPRGIERKNNPFGYREEDTINSFQEFRLNSFTNVSHFDYPNYIPVYDVVGKKGSFQYIMEGGKVKIIG